MTVAGRTRFLAAILLVAGGAAVIAAAIGLGGMLAGLAYRAPVIENQGIDGTGLLAGIGLLAIGIVVVLPVDHPAPNRRVSGHDVP